MKIKNGTYLLCVKKPEDIVVNILVENLEYDFKIIFKGNTVEGFQHFEIKRRMVSLDLLWEEDVEISIQVNEDEEKEVSFEVIKREE